MAAGSSRSVPSHKLGRRTLIGAAIAASIASSVQCRAPGATTGRDSASGDSPTATGGLASWFSALRSRQPETLLQVAAVGHSIVFGMGSAGTNRETDAQVGKSWVAELRRLFNAPDHLDPAEGWMLAMSDSRIDRDNVQSSQRAPLAEGAQLHASSRLTTELTGAEAWVMYWQADEGSGGVPRIFVEGDLVSVAPGEATGGMVTLKATGLGSGSHQVMITGPAEGTAQVAAIAAMNPAGIAVHRLSRSGSTMAQLVRGPSLSVTDRGVLAAIQAATWKDAQLGIIECLTNDQTKQTPVSDYRAATESMIEGALDNGCYSVLLVADPASEDPGSPTPESAYQEALAALVQQYPHNVAYLSIAGAWGTYQQGNSANLYQPGSSVHPSTEGHLKIAEQIHSMITKE